MIKKLIYILILFILFVHPSIAQTQSGAIEENIYGYKFKQGDDRIFLQKANANMKLWENSIIKLNRDFYLNEAMRYYYLLSKYDNSSIEAQIGLGRVYDELKLDKSAKEHFYLAYNMDNLNPKLNFYFGNFYYKRNDLVTALFHYKRAYSQGFPTDYFFNYRLGSLYEKLADIETSKQFYQKAQKLNPKDAVLANKIKVLDTLNYNNSQYYLFRK